MKGDRFWLWLAQRLPRRLRYWTVIVAGAEATTGEWADTEVPALLLPDLLKRIERRPKPLQAGPPT
jgi:hypothetical protein